MDLNQYIKQSYKRPNRQVLESLGANERLIEYLMETPGNTNWNVINAIQGSGEDVGEIWFTGIAEGSSEDQLQEIILTPTDKADTTISLTEYDIAINGIELPYFEDASSEEEGLYSGSWYDSAELASATHAFMYESIPAGSHYVAVVGIPHDYIGEVTVTVSPK